MARRDNQGIQIAMIVFILTTLLFMVGTYLGYSSWAAANGKLEQAESDRDSAQTQMRQASTTADKMKTAVGLDASQDDASAQTEAERLVKEVYGAGLPAESQNFISIVRGRDARIASLASDLKKANDEISSLNEKLKQALATQTASVKAARDKETAASEELNAEQAKWLENVAQRDRRVNEISAQRDAATAAQRAAESEASKLVAAAQASEQELQERASTLREKLNEIERDTPDKYDGSILAVDARTKSVILNVGSADGIRPKTTFGVYDAEDTNVRTAKKKASIEITKVLSETTSEARITGRSREPIVARDNVYSPIWSPGTRLGIALVGEMDVDRDGKDDREYIKSLIRTNGGEVDAEVVDGKIVGAMDVNTRYLVVGEGIIGGTDASVATAKADAKMMQNAQRLSVEQMSIDELMDLMSPPGRARSIRYGKSEG